MSMRTQRRVLIAIGIPLATGSIVWAVLFGGIYGVLGVMGAYTAMRTIDMIYERD